MKKIFIRSVIVLAVLVAVGVAAGVIAKYWVIPGMIASRIEAATARQWDGKVKVGSVDFSYSGPILIRNIEIDDRAQRPWLHVGSVELTLRDWPGTSPVITAVDVRGVTVNTHVVNGRLDLPPRKQEEPSSTDMSKYVDLQRLTVREISYTMIDDQSRQATWAFQKFEATRQPSGVYQVSLTSPPAPAGKPADAGQTISISGSIDHKTYDADLTLDGGMPADSERMAVVLHAMTVPVIKALEGRVHYDRARMRGRISDLGLWQLGGQIALENFQVKGPYGDLAQGLYCAMELNGRTIRIAQFNASGCKGTVTVSGQADIGANWTVTYRGMLDAANVDLPMLTETVSGPGGKAQRGILSLQVKYSGVGGHIRGAGLLGLDDADVMPLPVFGEIFLQMNLVGRDELRKSDVRAVMTFDGPRLIVEQGRLANALSAMDVEKGGRINVQTRQLDLYIIGVPLKAVESILKLPVIDVLSEPFRNLHDKLFRLHVQGDWSAPPNTIVRKEPVKDVSEGTVGFFKDVAGSGGKLGGGAVKAVGDLFRALSGG